jgi:hypothetical protein
MIDLENEALDSRDRAIKDWFPNVVVQKKAEFIIELAILERKDLLIHVRTPFQKSNTQ